jgi:hypothetical protein
MARYGALIAWAGQLNMPKSGGLAERKLARGDEGGKAVVANRSEQGGQNGCH